MLGILVKSFGKISNDERSEWAGKFYNRINNFKETHYMIHTHVFIIISEKLKQGVIMERVLRDNCDTGG